MHPIPLDKGFGSETHKEFLQFLNYSRRSLLEVQSQLYLAMDQKYINQNQFDNIYGELEIISKQISKFITYLRDSN